MNPGTGEVVQLDEQFRRRDPERFNKIEREWVQFNIGEVIEVRGIRFKVHDVSDQRLVLKFAK